MPALSEKDKKDLQFGVEQGVDFIFASFIRSAADVLEVREALGKAGSNIKIISKIENHQGIQNFNEILKVTDGVMVARGDLGIEIPPEKVCLAQKMMISRCNIVGKPIICATQMLESMTYNPRPTRAEVSDVANAVLDGSDCVMLSGETAKGIYPVETVEMMARICTQAENAFFYEAFFNQIREVTPKPLSSSEAVACASVNAAFESHVSAIIVLTTTGDSARQIAKYRPSCPIFAVTRDAQAARQLHLYRACIPMLVAPKAKDAIWQDDVDARFLEAVERGKKLGFVSSGDPILVVQGWKGGVGNTNTIRLLNAA